LAQAEHPEETQIGEPEVVVITRYPNRRLYDRSQGKYVTLEEIADTVRQGKTIVVRDSKTGEDRTRLLLTQIILEQFPERMELFPVAVLHSMIRANAQVLGFLRDYFRQALSYLEVLQKSAAMNPFLPPLDWMRFFIPSLSPPAQGDKTAPSTAALDAEALARRVAELEQRLDRIGSTKASPPKKSGRAKGSPKEKR
jgi:polyhydroxyalkanoate synthesis repressor PhaR